MKSKHLIMTGAACLMVGLATAQSQIERSVDVTRAYEPSVQNALKLNMIPDMSDTTQMRMDFEYQITPRPLSYGFAVNPLTPARIAAVGDPERYPFYAKVGIGFPMQSVADLRYATALNPSTRVGAYVSHYGRYAKIENDMDIKEKAGKSDNRAGAFIDFSADDDFLISGEINYDYHSAKRYGYYRQNAAPSYFDLSDEAMKQYYQDGGVKFSLGNSFTDLSKFNFKLDAGINLFGDRYKYNQMAYDLGLWFGFGVGYDGFLKIGAEYSGNSGQKNFDNYSGYLGKVGLGYQFDNGEFRVKLGGYFGFTDTKWEANEENDNFKGTFLPEVLLEMDLLDGGLTPFIDVRGTITDNSYRALIQRNPYLYSGQYALNTVDYGGRAGVKGTIGSSFKYKVYGGYSILENAAFWANAYEGYNSPGNGASYAYLGNQGNVFTVLSDDLNYFEAGLEMQANFLNVVTLTGGLNYYNYSPDTFEEAWGMPEMKIDFNASYNHRNKFYLNAGFEYIGKRQMYSLLGSNGMVNEVAGQFDLKVGADYFINKQFGVFLQLNNLLGHNIYYFNRYKELGINGTAGVKISF